MPGRLPELFPQAGHPLSAQEVCTMRAMARHDALIAEKRRNLQLETLYDLAIALHAQRPEQELVDELLQRVCAVLDPAAAVAVTRDAYGGSRGSASVGWLDDLPTGDELLAAAI